jgi:thiol-disulfide isomerase/thioredoxin
LETEIKRDTRVSWLICFGTTWSPPCNDFAPVFAEISAKFGGLNSLKFGKFDCSMYPDIAKKFNVTVSPLSKQMPTVILFENGVETRRRPFVDSKGTVYKFLFSYANMVKDFDLTKLYYECKQKQIEVKPIETQNLIEKTNSKEEKKKN